MKKLSLLLLLILSVTILAFPLIGCNTPKIERSNYEKQFLLSSSCNDKTIHEATVEILKERFLGAKYKRSEFKITLNEDGTILVECSKAENVEILLRTGELTFKDSQGNVWLNGQDHVKSAYAANDVQDVSYMVILEFTERGTARFADATNTIKDMSDNIIYIYLGDVIIITPQVNEQIVSPTAQITGNFTYEEALTIASIINSKALPIQYTITDVTE